MNEIKVIVFDDNPTRRNSLELLIDGTDGMHCIGTFENCNHVLDDVRRLNPNVILMDIEMPGVNGIEAVKLIRKFFPQVFILMQTVFDEDEKIFDSICAGANGYILKKTPPIRLLEGIREVAEGGAPMTASVAKQVLSMVHKHAPRSENIFELTQREKEVLSFLVKGMSYKMIGDACNISPFTVNTHIKKIYEKLHVHTAHAAVAKAINEKLL
ncbi:MAG TPA: response regulator transcription factor [Chitinophagales bacterium]|nr:response regulator transcription factor [Chitinophagales bacterium]